MFKKNDLEEFLHLYDTPSRLPYSDFEELIIDDLKSADTPFEEFYRSIIDRYENLKIEISENLLSLPNGDRQFYIDYLHNRLNSYIYAKPDPEELFDLLNSFDVNTGNLSYSNNPSLQKILEINFSKSSLSIDELRKIQAIHKKYFIYILDLKLNESFELIQNYREMNSNITNIEKLKWIGNPSQLGFIIGTLADLGYIEAPKHKSGDINYTKFAKLVNNTFQIKTTDGTLSKYLNLTSDKAQETVGKFNKNKTHIPHIKEVS